MAGPHPNRSEVSITHVGMLLVVLDGELIGTGEQHFAAKNEDCFANGQITPMVVVVVLVITLRLRAARPDSYMIILHSSLSVSQKWICGRWLKGLSSTAALVSIGFKLALHAPASLADNRRSETARALMTRSACL